MMKRRYAITWAIIAGIMVICLAACGTATTKSGSGETAKGGQETTGTIKGDQDKDDVGDKDDKNDKNNPDKDDVSASFYDNEFAKKGLNKEQYGELMEEIADKDITPAYKTYIPNDGLAAAKIFEVEKDGSNVKAYAYLSETEYACVEGNAYPISGSSGECIISYHFNGDDLELDKVEWGEDGEGHEKWIKSNFPGDIKTARDKFLSENGPENLAADNDKIAEKYFGLSVNNDDLLEIDPDTLLYTISKVEESGDPANNDYKFDTKVISSGSLKDLK